MNDKAKELGLKNTRFENPAGIDARGNYSSASDLAKITREAMKYPEFREIIATPEATISTQDRQIYIVNTNLLVVPNSGYDYGPATGVKTGTSLQAGACLVASAESGDESYIAVVLDAAGDLQRFDAATTALEYGFGEYERKPLVSPRGCVRRPADALPQGRDRKARRRQGRIRACRPGPRGRAAGDARGGAPIGQGRAQARHRRGLGGRPSAGTSPLARPRRLRSSLPVAEDKILGRRPQTLGFATLTRCSTLRPSPTLVSTPGCARLVSTLRLAPSLVSNASALRASLFRKLSWGVATSIEPYRLRQRFVARCRARPRTKKAESGGASLSVLTSEGRKARFAPPLC